jgi:hypothetical protein
VDHFSQYPAGKLVQWAATDAGALAVADDHVDAAFRAVEQADEVFERIRAVRVGNEYPVLRAIVKTGAQGRAVAAIDLVGQYGDSLNPREDVICIGSFGPA